MKIGELARAAGVSPRAIRHYEAQGLLQSKRLPNGYRVFEDSAVRTIRQIGVLFEVGLPIKTILQLVPCLPDQAECIKLCPLIREAVEKHREQLQHRLDDLNGLMARLDTVLD